MKNYKAYINGKFVLGNEKIEIISPESNEVVGTVPALNKKFVKKAFEAAKESQRTWELETVETRIDIISTWADKLEEVAEDMAKIMVLEIAKPIESAKSEVARSIKMIKDIVSKYKDMYEEKAKDKSISEAKKEATIYRKPLGVITAISPFNYPINLAVSKIAPALVSGNSVVFKPATNGSIIATFLAETLHKAGIPAGVFNLVTGKGSKIGKHLTTNKHINGILFTGSEKVGIEISERSKMANVVLELGGKDAAIIREDADIELTTTAIIKGAFSFSGQRCTAIKRVLVQAHNKKAFTDLLVEKTRRLIVGDAKDNSQIAAVIDKTSANKIMDLVNDAIKKGAKALTPIIKQDNLIYPIILDNVTEDMGIAWEEQFGPVLPIIKVKNDAEAIKVSNKSRYGLQASIFSKDIKIAQEMAMQLEVGSVNINGSSQRGPDDLPFVGVKNSGLGSQGIKDSILSVTRPFNIVNNK